ncbi:MAG: hypothetical protein K2X32_11595 [Phycisphaerales bacterium]|nr:hypothetical protein [Phycisphaerales bacterium]
MIPIFAATVAWSLTVFLLGLLAYKILRRQWDLLSFNTLLLVGFVQFFSLPVSLFSVTDVTQIIPYFIASDSDWNSLAAMMLLYVAVALVAYRIGRRFEWGQKYLPRADLPVSYGGIIIVLGVTLVSIAITIPLGFTSYLSFAAIMFRPAFIAFAAGLATVLVIKQPRNLGFWAVFLFILVAGLLVSMSFNYGRRDPLGVFLAIVWVAYWMWLRYQPMLKQVTVGIIGSSIIMVFLLGYTAVRGDTRADLSDVNTRIQQFSGLLSGQRQVFDVNNLLMVFYQDSALNSAYAISKYPSTYPLMPFHGATYFLVNPIPRVFWEDKPIGIGNLFQNQLRTGGNLGVGIIAHGWVEGLAFGVAAYAAFFGIMSGMLDGALRRSANNPYIIAAAGTGLGHVLAIPRGETSLLCVLWLYGFASVIAALWVAKLAFGDIMKALGPFGFGSDDPANAEGVAAIDAAESGGSRHAAEPVEESLEYGDEEFLRYRDEIAQGPSNAPA